MCWLPVIQGTDLRPWQDMIVRKVCQYHVGVGRSMCGMYGPAIAGLLATHCTGLHPVGLDAGLDSLLCCAALLSFALICFDLLCGPV